MPDVGALVERVKRLPVVRVVVAVQQRYGEEGAGLLASAITYQAFFSLFPLILVGFSVLGYILDDPDEQRRFIESAAGSIPGIQPLLGDSLDALVNTRAATGIIGLLGLAWTGTQIVRVSGRALTQVFNIDLEDDNFIKQNAWAIGSLLALGLLAAAAIGVSFVGSNLPEGNAISTVLLVLVGAVVDVGLFLAAYRILTRGSGPSFRALLPGALFAAVGWTVLKLIGSWYARRTVGDAQAVYGTFAAAIGILVMLSFGARLFMYGAILTVVRMREQPSLQTTVMDMEPTDEIPDEESDHTEEVEDHMAERKNGEAKRSTVRLVRDIADDSRTLVRQEVELAKTEMTEAVMARLRGAIAFAVAGVLGLMVLIFGALAIEGALDGVMSDWAARLVVAGGLVVLAGMIAMLGVMRMKSKSLKPEETVKTVKEDVEWARAQLKR